MTIDEQINQKTKEIEKLQNELKNLREEKEQEISESQKVECDDKERLKPTLDIYMQVAYNLQEKQGMPSFVFKDIQKGMRDAQMEIPEKSGDFSKAFEVIRARGYLDILLGKSENSNQLSFRITKVGKEYVERGFKKPPRLVVPYTVEKVERPKKTMLVDIKTTERPKNRTVSYTVEETERPKKKKLAQAK